MDPNLFRPKTTASIKNNSDGSQPDKGLVEKNREKFDKFYELFLREVSELATPYYEGNKLLMKVGVNDFGDFRESMISNLILDGMKGVMQDGRLTDSELEFYCEFEKRMRIGDEKIDKINNYKNSVLWPTLMVTMETWVDDGSLFNAAHYPSVIAIGAYDHVNGTNYVDRVRHLFYVFILMALHSDGCISPIEEVYLEQVKGELWRDFPYEQILHSIESSFGNNYNDDDEFVDDDEPLLTFRFNLSGQLINDEEETEGEEVLAETLSKHDEPLDRETEKSFESCIAELQSLIGIPSVKEEVQRLVNSIKINQLRKEKGLPTTNINNHLVFYGNPGTGKTTVARLLAKIFKALGILEKGHLVEVDRSGLVAGYAGQTSLKTRSVVQSALGGVLFIDEAYALAKEGDNFGEEAVDTLLKLMEDHRKDLIVIAAGYTDNMNDFLESNPGLKSRFTRFMNFPNYTSDEMLEILNSLAKSSGMKLTRDAEIKAANIFDRAISLSGESFGNGRLARNLLHDAISYQADRLVKLDELDVDVLQTIIADDIPDKVDSI